MVVKETDQVFFREAREEVQKFFRDSTLDYVPTAEHRAYAEFSAMAQDRPVKRHIDQIHRIRSGGLKDSEKLYFCETHSSLDFRNNKITKYVVNGKFEKPIGQYQYDEITRRPVCIGIADFETVYQMKFDGKTLDDLIENGDIDGRTQYYVESEHGRMYGGFEYEDFRNMAFDELVHLGKTGFRPEDKSLELKSKDKKLPTGFKD